MRNNNHIPQRRGLSCGYLDRLRRSVRSFDGLLPHCNARIRPKRFVALVWLALFLGFAGSQSTVLAQDYALQSRGYVNAQDTYIRGSVLFRNASASPVVVRIIAMPSYGLGLTISGVVGSCTALWSLPYNTDLTVPANGSLCVPGNYALHFSQANIGLRTFGFTVGYTVNGNTFTGTSTRQVNITSHPSPQNSWSNYSATVGMVPPGGALYPTGTVPAYTYPALCEIDVVTAPPQGSLTLGGLKGDYLAQILMDGKVVAQDDHPLSATVDERTPGPNVWYTTDSPGQDEGKTVVAKVNGVLVAQWVVTLESTGGYSQYFNAGAVEYPDRIRDGDEEPLPVPDGPDSMPPPNPEDRPDVGAIPGTDPKGDATVDSDGTGPGTGLSVRDMYRAVRAAAEDAMAVRRNNQTAEDILGGSKMPVNSGTSGFGDTIGQGMQGLLRDPSFSMPVPGLNSSAGDHVLHTAWGNIVLPVFPWAVWIRGFFTLFLVIWFWRTMYGMFINTFSGSKK